MNKIGMEKKAITIIRNFLKDYKLDSLDNLKTFSFWKIKDDKDYNGYPGEYDGDRTNIVYAIDYLLYKDSIPNLTLRGFPCSNGKEGNYSGETICSFNTLFAKDLSRREQIKTLFGKEWTEIDDFFYVYQTIGNFMLLPSKTDDMKMSINNYKGFYNKDYIDFFLHNLKFYLENKSSTKVLGRLLEYNKFYFTENKKYDDFIDDFYLSDFNQMKFEGIHYYWWYNDSKIFSDEQVFAKYKLFALDFVTKSKILINKRSEKIVNVLKDKYKELNS